MSGRTRARLAGWMIRSARRLLGLGNGAADPDWDTCVHCGSTGCESGTAEHLPDCPTETGVFVVTLAEMWPGGPACCEGCGATLWPGETYSHIPIDAGDPPCVYQISCTGCALLAGIEARP